jgi:WD40 repeat protein
MRSGAARESIAVLPREELAFASGDFGPIKIWNIRSGKLAGVLNGHADQVRAFAVSSNGQLAVSAGDDRTMRVWDVDNHREREHLRLSQSDVTAMAVTPDARRAITVTKNERSLRVWDIEEGKRSQHVDAHAGPIRHIAIVGYGRFAVTGSVDGMLKVWDTRTARLRRTLSEHWAPIRGIISLPNRAEFVSVSEDCTMRVWNCANGKLKRTLGGSSPIYCVAASPDGRCVFVGVRRSVEAWDLARGQRVQSFDTGSQGPRDVLVTRDGKRIVAGGADGTVYIWDGSGSRSLFALRAHRSDIWRLALHSDDRHVVTASSDATLRVLDVRQGNLVVRLRGHRREVLSVVVRGSRAISGSSDHALISWDLTRGQPLYRLEGHGDVIDEVDLDRSGRFAISVSRDATVRLWNVPQQKQLAVFYADHPIRSLALSPGGRTVVAGDDGGQVHFLRIEGVR